ncbi:MAG: cation:proton antiporter subunit C [Pseudodesulfovibrio sp.]|uniref:NADH-ubiquinone oxidoreductase chain 4L n=1 Tax=Pseudodesulfovibrio aespoeensis (strain ATCC 700646 / DSM 10631 / Aspo-2) TaxID=643562 RepID=E6VT51_PSEA9|nr:MULTISPECIES: cation:proton antiporter subunit C [Pseudodesulfovibrio]MBU4475002.1 cation:proton antiporter subunit C [Pseudomonadota bacterium]ADU62101.1 NADH-ubiquinone oxidoreductase chain 4L [Pseudodesulfovibrio aespoeensis Aspo-2]MBU4515928.1 cation:proton antiporter subunit C [Pseudomonadota bacterium]MBU4522870.1 cation:proton antiporter subunit C [Pseudomonadota bacterium]MBU4559994.1 cation:proton antiporter subunit C [Pseudomonadota bacterium]
MEDFLTQLTSKYNFWAYIVLMMIGLYAMIAKGNLIKKLMGLGIFQTAIMLFYVAIGSKAGATIPILLDTHSKELIDFADYINPLPHVLMLTAIVVSVATLGVALALVQRIFDVHGTLEEDEILEKIKNP